MCGIVGFQGSFDAELLARMSDAVAHRGPDGAGAQMLGARPAQTGLGHRRLAIIDLSSAGLQPMTFATPQGALTIVYNGEIYNYRELRAELVAAGHEFRSASDTEVLLHAYQQYGTACVDRLNGIFAFALHDGRSSGRPDGVERDALFVARDQLGVKPLYYATTPSGFLFGSEIKALLRSREISREIDPFALHEMLAFLWTPAPRTMLAGVRKLEPGCALIVSGGRIARQWRYYEIPYDGRRSTQSRDALAGELAQALSTAVTRQLVADVPVGAFLSGGLDSSAIVALMRRELGDRPITCFTIGFEGAGATDADGATADLPYARRVARHLGVDLEEIQLTPDSIRRLPELVRLLDEPQADPAPINALLIAERARAMSIPVLLSGAGGDDLLGGYRRHHALRLERTWSWLPRPARSALQGMARASPFQRVPLARRMAKAFSYAAATPDRRLVSYYQWSTEALRHRLYTPQFAARVAGSDVAATLFESLARIPAETDPLQRMLYLDTKHFLADHNLNYTDRAGMAVGVEVRVPFLDKDFVQFATRIPTGFKQRGAVGKPLFKQAMESYLPRDVIYRPKTGFGAPLRRWLSGELRPMVDETLDPATLARRGFFEPGAVRDLVAADRRGTVDGAYTLFALMCFELWCREFMD
jgi:asparagine synthase (glutamine-hydrolysing)